MAKIKLAADLEEERDKLTKDLANAKDEVTRIFADEGHLLRGTINDLRRDLEGSQLALKNCDAARAAFAAELAQLKGKMAADKQVMDELSDAAARGRNLEVT